MGVLGVDVGSSAAKAVLLDDEGRVRGTWSERSLGRPAEAARRLLERAYSGGAGPGPLRVGATGSGRSLFAAAPGVFVVNEIVALALAADRIHPGVRTIIEIGAQTSRWVLLDRSGPEAAGPSPCGPDVLDFAMNEACAAGCGAFLEQQACRLRLELEEFGRLAMSARKGAAVAGRCSVFAKSDMIHLQQKGTPAEEIAYGLCLALARNFSATVVRGRGCPSPVLFVGGAARNPALARAFRDVLGLTAAELVVGDRPEFAGAVGAAAGALAGAAERSFAAASDLASLVGPEARRVPAADPPLGALRLESRPEPCPRGDERVRGFLGIDVGSVSTNLALVDEAGEVKAGVYVPTCGRPIEALRDAFARLEAICPAGFEVLGCGSTGSGRHLAGRLLRTDVVHNEITCQLRSAAAAGLEADSVFEIGGQDSKFIGVAPSPPPPGGAGPEPRPGIRDFAMNKVCAAGTGSFLEEQAGLLGIEIEDQFAAAASRSGSPCTLSSRCTVFMETEVAEALGRGVPVEDVAAGLSFAIARSYLEKVVAGRPVGDRVVFQGGVASNPAVVRAFEIELGRPVHVHPHNRVSGAIGAALLAREARASRSDSGGAAQPARDGRELRRRLARDLSVSSFVCGQCSNSCQVNRIAVEGESIFFGDTCERYTSTQGRGAAGPAPPSESNPSGRADVPDLFADRERLLGEFLCRPTEPRFRIAIPRASFMHELLPFWAAFWSRLDGEVVLSAPSTGATLESGSARLPAETCLPIKLAFGHVAALAASGEARIFFPSIVDRHRDPDASQHFCPYTESFPAMARSAAGDRLMAGLLRMNGRPEEFLGSLRALGDALGVAPDRLRDAWEAAAAAQDGFDARMRERGARALRELRAAGRGAWVVIGRPYMLHDPFLNLGLARHLVRLGIPAIPMDALETDVAAGPEWPGTPPWRYTRRAIRAALWCASQPDVHPVVLTSFGCNLDAFNLRHVARILEERSPLVLEFDEHRGEAGLITRLEAYADEAEESERRKPRSPLNVVAQARNETPTPPGLSELKSRPVVIPRFSDHAFAFSGAFRSAGMEARVMPLPDDETKALGERASTGKECHAYSLIAGDFVKAGREDGPPRTYFFPGARYVCVLNQYDRSLNYLAEDMGLRAIRAFAPPMEGLFALLGMRAVERLWQGLVGIDLLERARCATRPYELAAGECDRAHEESLRDIEAALAAGDPGPALERSADRLRSVRVRREPRPVVGIAGDIYTRQNFAANHGLATRLEALGCEIRPAPFLVDEIDFSIRKALETGARSLRIGAAAAAGALYLRKEWTRRGVRRRLGGDVARTGGPSFDEVVRFTAPYLGLDNNSSILMNVAEMVDFAAKGADGVVNAICFNCMLGTVSAALAGRIREDYHGIPIPTFVYAGTETAAERTRLEAFAHQVKRFAERRRTRV